MKKRTISLAFLLGYLVLMFLPVIVDNEGIFIFYGDSYEQLYHYFVGAWQKVHHGMFGGFDFSIGLGASFLSTTFYSITPFFCILLLLPLAFVKYSFLYLTILKLFCIVVFSAMWIAELTENKVSRIIGTMVFAFSGWVVFYMVVGFLDFFVLYPLVLFCAEKYLKKGKVLPLVLSLAGLCISNYYFGYMFVPFLCMYALYRYMMIFPNAKIIEIVKAAFVFFGYVLLSVGLSAFALLPNAYIILQEPRLEESIDLFAHIQRLDLFHLLSSLFSPVMDRFNVNLYVDESLHSFIGWNGGATLFAGMIVPLLLPLILFMKNKRERNGLLIFYTALAFFGSFFAFYRLFQGTIESRWFYMFSAVHAIMSVRVSEEVFDHQISKKYILISWFLSCVGIIFCVFYASRNQLFIQGYAGNIKKIIGLTLLFVSIIATGFFMPKKVRLAFITGVLLIENLVYFREFLKANPTMEASVIEDVSLTDRSVIEEIQSMDADFYRIMYGTVESTTQNEPNAKAFAGTTFYSSLYNYAQEDYLARFKSSWSSPQAYGRFKSLNLLGTKYYYSSGFYQPMEWGYDFLTTVNDTTDIYVNPYSYGLGYASSQTVNEDHVKTLSYFDQDRLMMDHIVTSDSKNEELAYSDTLIYVGEFTGDEILIELDHHYWDFVVHFVYDSGAQFQIDAYELFDWLNVGSYYFWQENYTSIYFNEHQYVKYFKLNLLDEEISTVKVYLEKPQETYPQMYETLSEQMFYDVSYNQNEVHAKIDIHEKDAVAFTNIPVDEGWRVWVDGQEIEPMKVNLGFIGFELNEGTHEIEMKYSLPWFKEGLMISIVSLMGFLVVIMKKRKMKAD